MGEMGELFCNLTLIFYPFSLVSSSNETVTVTFLYCATDSLLMFMLAILAQGYNNTH